MTRIVAGAARGRRLAVPGGEVTRPTSDRAREAIFSTLAGLTPLSGTHVLDLYAGSGALGLEALSRGAVHVLLVENDRRVAITLRANLDAVELDGAVVSIRSVQQLATSTPTQHQAAAAPYDVVFADPPYRLPAEDLGTVIAGLHEHGWLAPEAVLVIERSARDDPWTWPTPFEAIRDRRYGEACLWYGRAP